MTSANIRRWGLAKLAAVASLLALAGPAGGQSKGPAAPPSRLDPAAAAAELARPDTIAARLAAIQSAGPAASKLAPAVEELLARGLPPDLAVSAIAALGAVGARSSSAVIAPYLSHRSANVRRIAAEALGNTRGPQAASALAAGLRSLDADVRAASARSLRFAGDQDSVPDLLRALDRGEVDAAPSIAALCAPDQCKELFPRWEAIVRWDKIASGAERNVLDAMLERRPRLPDDVLLLAVTKAIASESPATKAYLQAIRKNKQLSPLVRKAIEAAAREPERKP